jgi:peptidoglycan biosynthesis protein MviN/MurJ (putative lipid II flippase)
MRVLNLIAVGGIVINVVLNLIMIPTYGALGITIATLFTQSVVALLHIMAANASFQVKWQWGLILRLVCYIGIAIALSWGMTYIPMHWMGRITLNAALLGILILLLRLVPVDMLKRLRGVAN